eukprot:TRINITY_DN334_c0_g3_i1.p1 TRINITY_DN334_c0_g3~~TRINITY_DN334_c0_g3_i1.p1  ORF type:complete len:689 (+),score=269.59 TRINITY_DN334_c0_g3_i1:103-2067(+)
MDKSLLKKATADTAEPTPGHYYRDIANMTCTDIKVCVKVRDYLIERLETAKGPYQMIKSLKVIRHVAQHGHTEFQKDMQKCELLRTMANHRGKMDPVHGDELNQKVREAAKEAIDACFREQVKSKLGVQGEGGGSPQRDRDSPGFGTGQKVVHGMGSDEAAARFQKQFDKVHGCGSGPEKKEVDGVASQFKKAAASGFGLLKTESTGHAALRQKVEDSQQGGYQQIQIEGHADPAAAAAAQPTFKFLTEGAAAGGSPTAAAAAVRDEEVALSELQQLVDQICGRASSPGRLELSKFVRDCQSCLSGADEEEAGELPARIDAKLAQRNPFQQRLNALFALEALVKAGVECVVEYFKENPEDIQRNVCVVQATVKERAKKVLGLLGCPEQMARPAAPGAGVVTVGGAPAAGGDAARGGESAGQAQGGGGAQQVRGRAPKETGLKKRQRKHGDPQDGAADSGLAAAPASPSSAGSGGGLFDGLALSGPAQPAAPAPAPAAPQPPAPSAAPPPAAAPPPQQPQQMDALLFGGAPPAAAPPAAPVPVSAPAATADPFADLFGGSPAAAHTPPQGSASPTFPPTPAASPAFTAQQGDPLGMFPGAPPAAAQPAAADAMALQQQQLMAQIAALQQQQQLLQQQQQQQRPPPQPAAAAAFPF